MNSISCNNNENPKTIKVFVCGGGNPVSEFYYNEAYNLGKGLAKIGTAYGQGGLIDRHTIMGESYYGYKENSGKEIKFILREKFKDDITPKTESGESLHIVQDITELVREQFMWADVIVIMPGGTGTIEELFGHCELQLDYENHPKIILYNQKLQGKQAHFFDATLSQIHTSIKEDFIGKDSPVRNIVVKYTVPEILVEIMKERSRIYHASMITNGRDEV